jgi:hypothetical protein
MADWILWPADALLSAGAYVASWFASKDTPGFLQKPQDIGSGGQKAPVKPRPI